MSVGSVKQSAPVAPPPKSEPKAEAEKVAAVPQERVSISQAAKAHADADHDGD
jgi:hypothetical protein